MVDWAYCTIDRLGGPLLLSMIPNDKMLEQSLRGTK